MVEKSEEGAKGSAGLMQVPRGGYATQATGMGETLEAHTWAVRRRKRKGWENGALGFGVRMEDGWGREDEGKGGGLGVRRPEYGCMRIRRREPNLHVALFGAGDACAREVVLFPKQQTHDDGDGAKHSLHPD